MARYKKPDDPRNSGLKEIRQRRQRGDYTEPIPWLWLGLGFLVTVAAILVAIRLANNFLARPPLSVSVDGMTPTIIRLTAPPTRAPTITPVQPTATPIPTLTPMPTADLSAPPDALQVGFYARVVPEEGVTVRGGPSTQNVIFSVANQNTLMMIIGGPAIGGDYEWWEVRLDDETEGWVAGSFIEPAPAPAE